MLQEIFGASVRGASHLRAGTECQDSWKQLMVGTDTLIIAAADGHGSRTCPYSKTGAVVAVNVFCKVMSAYAAHSSLQAEQLPTFLNREGELRIAQEIEQEWKRRILLLHRKQGRELPRDSHGNPDKGAVFPLYGTTLLGLLLTEQFLFAFQLGDGDILFLSEAGAEPVLRGRHLLGTETDSLGARKAWERAVCTLRLRGTQQEERYAFLLATDGFSNSYATQEAFLAACQAYYESIERHGARQVAGCLRRWLSETSEQGSGDDITAVFAYFDSARAKQEACSGA